MSQEYSVTLRSSSRDLLVKERIKAKFGLDDSISINEVVKESGEVILGIDYYAIFDVYNGYLEEGKEYEVLLIMDKDGNYYTTSSQNLMRSLDMLWEDAKELESEGEDVIFRIYGKESKNYKNNNFLAITIL